MTRRITITVGNDGSIVAESSGEPGPSCLDGISVIESLCDTAVVTTSRLTPEYHATIKHRSQDDNYQVNLNAEAE